MSSPLRRLVPGENRWVNLGFQESAKRAPVNVRPLLMIPRRRSFKGCALFASAHLDAYELTGWDHHRREAERLLRWLWETRKTEPFGWGHNHDIQLLDGRVPRNTPNIVSTTYATRAFLEQSRMDDAVDLDSLVAGVASLIEDDLLVETSTGPRIKYDTVATPGSYVVNANALAGALLVDLGERFGHDGHRELGESVLDYVADRQASNGGWVYADPPEDSHLSMDNHHNGFIVESFLRYRMTTGSDRYDDVIDRGLRFYRRVLFESDGRPNWDESNSYPRDIHAAAQGIITFSMVGDDAFARRILGWTRASLYDGSGRFYYRDGRFLTRRFTLMRWCQAWMAYAIGRYCTTVDHGEHTPFSPMWYR